jgi:serine/threonine protein kinase
MDRLEGARLGDYELVERIGGGGMAEVYRARQLTAFGREVAMKIIRPGFSEQAEFRARFLREAQAISKLSHPNILPLIEFGEERQTLYLVMPLVREGTLRDLLKEYNGPLPSSKVIELFTQLCNAVHYAHAQGIIHRDIKPQNVLLQQGTHVLLADFGIARDSAETRMTSTGAGVGTVEYMAPEQALGQGDVRSDIYSLGVVLYQMVTGVVPYSGSTPLQVLIRHTNEGLPDPRRLNPSLPLRLVQVLQIALAKDPNARFQSAQALGQAVSQMQTEMPAQPGPQPSSRLPGSGVALPSQPSGPSAPQQPPAYPGAALPYAPTSQMSTPPGSPPGTYSGAYRNPSAGASNFGPPPAETFNSFRPTGAIYPPPAVPPSQPGWSAPTPGFGTPPQPGPGMPAAMPGYSPPAYPGAPGYTPPGYPGGPGAPAPRKNQTGLIAIISVVVVVVLLVGSLVVVGYTGKGPFASLGGQQTPAASPTPTHTPTPTATPTPSAPPGFQAFTNAPQNTFSIDYPNSWQQIKSNEGSGAEFVGPLGQVVYATDIGALAGDPATLDNSFCEGSNGSGGFGGTPTSPVQVTIGGQQWTQEECDGSSGDHAAVETIYYNGHTYLIAYASSKTAFSANRSQYFTPMEQTFKFLT